MTAVYRPTSGFHNPCTPRSLICNDNPAPLQSQWTTPFTAAASSRLNRHAGGRRRPVRRAKTRAVGPISALWEWDQDENHHQAQLDICTQFGPNPPGNLGADIRQTDRQADRQTDRHPSFIYQIILSCTLKLYYLFMHVKYF